LVEKPNSPIKFQPAEFAWWGYVLRADVKLVAIALRNGPQSVMTFDRFRVGGPTEPGDAVVLDFRKVRGGWGRGAWFAKPLGYKAEWERIPTR
jgi:hypothetical protein